MDLRSAHKTPEKPPPRLRLSLSRSLVPEDEDEDEDQTYSACRQGPQPQLAHRKSGPRRSEFQCLDSPWESRGEEEDEEDDEEEDNVEDEEDREEEEEEKEEKEEALKETTEKSGGILNGKWVSRSASRLQSPSRPSLLDST